MTRVAVGCGGVAVVVDSQRRVKEAKKYLEDFPENYNALRDGLASREDHAMTVNELLKHLRAVLGLIK
jgi:hypothetical protein